MKDIKKNHQNFTVLSETPGQEMYEVIDLQYKYFLKVKLTSRLCMNMTICHGDTIHQLTFTSHKI